MSGGPYHSWGPEGSDIHELLRLFNMSFQDIMAKVNPYRGGMLRNLFVQYQAFPALVALQENTPRLLIPLKSWQQVQRGNGKRLAMVIGYFQRALAIQLHSHQEKFASLRNALTRVGIIPLGMDLGDFRGCLDPSVNTDNKTARDYDIKASLESNIPLFATCRSFDCRYAFPIPNYGDYHVMKMAGGGDGAWDKRHDEWNTSFPWEHKQSKVYWRGGIKFARYEFLERVEKASLTENITSYLDVKQAKCPRNANPNFCSAVEPADTSMKYKAVFDIDGNSWSDRFPRLLCYNSAVIKITVEEDYEEYFMADLEPNVHFIPASLENFTQVAAYYMKDNQDSFLRQIVQNANAFCKARFTEERLNLDFLSILNSYVETLEQYRNEELCNTLEKSTSRLSCWMKLWLEAKESYIGLAAQDQHKGFTDLCRRPIIPHLGSEGSNSTVWDLEAYQVPDYDSVCPG